MKKLLPIILFILVLVGVDAYMDHKIKTLVEAPLFTEEGELQHVRILLHDWPIYPQHAAYLDDLLTMVHPAAYRHAYEPVPDPEDIGTATTKYFRELYRLMEKDAIAKGKGEVAAFVSVELAQISD